MTNFEKSPKKEEKKEFELTAQQKNYIEDYVLAILELNRSIINDFISIAMEGPSSEEELVKRGKGNVTTETSEAFCLAVRKEFKEKLLNQISKKIDNELKDRGLSI